MKNARLLPLAFVLFLATLTSGALAQQFPDRITDPHGFSIVPPIGWKLQSQSATSQLSKSVADRIDSKSFTDGIAMMLVNPGSKGIQQNINVVVTHGAPRSEPTDSDVAAFRNSVEEGYRNANLDSQILSSKLGLYAGHKAFEIETELRVNGVQVHELQVAIPVNGTFYIVTGTASDDTFAMARPVFMQAINTMEFSGDDRGSSPTGLFNLRSLIIYAVTGGIVGGIIALIAVATQRKRH